MAEKKAVVVPEPPKHLPAELQEQWKRDYVRGHEQAQEDFPDDGFRHQEAAIKEANRLLRVPAPTSYEEAVALKPHQVAASKTEKGVHTVVTSDGKKYKFPVGSKATAPPSEKKEEKKSA